MSAVVTALLPFLCTGLTWAEYRTVQVEQGATIRGVARWNGDSPEIPPLIVSQQKDACGRAVPSPVLQIDPKTKGVRFVLVYLESIERGKAPRSRYILHAGKHDSRPRSLRCNFEEHVFAFERHSIVGFQNFEKTLHTIHTFDAQNNTLFNVVLTNPGQIVSARHREVQGAGVRYQCDAHAHMQGWMAGFDHPYFDTTDSLGRFELTDVPPGRYTLVAWHEGYDIVGIDASQRVRYDEPHIVKKRIEVKDDETVEIEFVFPAR